jgi:hypothetical protein
MIITKEAQERIVEKWDKQDKSSKEYIAFREGMEAVFAFIKKYQKTTNLTTPKSNIII